MKEAVKEFTKQLIPVTDFTKLKPGDKIFSIHSLDVNYVDTFESYDPDSNWIEYRNYLGEPWGCRVEEGEWFHY